MAGLDREKALEVALAQIDKQFGKGSVMRLGDEARAPVRTIPTGSIALDVALGVGGLPRGRVVEVYGPEASGKTTVALHAVANAQAAGGIAAFVDAEHALDPEYAKALGVDTDALLVSQPDTGEQALEITDMLIRSGALDVVVIDSVAALVPRAEIEGEMGDSHVGLQARLMSQALRKITGALSNSGTTAIFINQLREKVGVMFGCASYNTRVTLTDGTQEKIGKIVNQKLPVEVLSYDPDLGKVVPRRVVNWFDNGVTDEFLQFTVARPGGNGRAQMALTRNHLVRTPGGWREAGELAVGDRVMLGQSHRLSPTQWQVVLGSLLGDGNLVSGRNPDSSATRFRMGNDSGRVDYLNWKASLFGNVEQSRSIGAEGVARVDMGPLPELTELSRAVYLGDGRKHLSWDYLKALTPLSLAVWYMDHGTLAEPSEQRQEGSRHSEIAAHSLSAGSLERLVQHLGDEFGLRPHLSTRGRSRRGVLVFDRDETAKLHELVAPYVCPSMQHKLLEAFRGRFAVTPEFVEPTMLPVPAPILDIRVKPRTRSMHRFDIEVEGSHNYLADGIIVHNSPETTSGGRALKFYSSVRLDVRRIETLKDGSEAIGNRTRVKVVKNKCLAEGTRVFDPETGLTHRIEDVVDRQMRISVVAAGKDNRLHVRPVTSWFDQGEQDVLGLRTSGDTTLWVTPDHQVLTERGWRLAGELAPGDRLARPRRFLGFGDARPMSADQARLLGHVVGGGDAGCGSGTSVQASNVHRGSLDNDRLALQRSVPTCLLAPDVSAEMVGNFLLGLFETCGWISRERTLRAGFTTVSEQLAQQVHWLLLRFGITSEVRRRAATRRGPNQIPGRYVHDGRDRHQVRVTGSEAVAAFGEAIPTWGPRGQELTQALGEDRREWNQGGNDQVTHLPDDVVAPILDHLGRRGVSAVEAARIVGASAGDPRGGMRQVLGRSRLRRDRVQALTDGLDDPFLHDILGEEVRYSTIRKVLPMRRCRTFDVEVDELHTLVAEDVVVHNCAAPFKQAEFDIVYGQGISREGSLIDVGVEQSLIRKSGAWYTYDGDQLGQGKENARSFLRDNPDLADEIEKKIKERLGIGARDLEAASSTAEVPAPGDLPVGTPSPGTGSAASPSSATKGGAAAKAGTGSRPGERRESR